MKTFVLFLLSILVLGCTSQVEKAINKQYVPTAETSEKKQQSNQSDNQISLQNIESTLNPNPSGLVSITITNHNSCQGKDCINTNQPNTYQIQVTLAGKRWKQWQLHLVNTGIYPADKNKIKRYGKPLLTKTATSLEYTETWHISSSYWVVVAHAIDNQGILHSDKLAINLANVLEGSSHEWTIKTHNWTTKKLSLIDSTQGCADPSHGTLGKISEQSVTGIDMYLSEYKLEEAIAPFSSQNENITLKKHKLKNFPFYGWHIERAFCEWYLDHIKTLPIFKYPSTRGWSLVIYPASLNLNEISQRIRRLIVISPPPIFTRTVH